MIPLTRIRENLETYVLLTVGGLLLAINVDLFLAPSKIAPGGVSGTAILINHFTGWPIGTTMLVLNIPLLVLGFQNLGRFKFLTKTVYVVLLYNLGADVIAHYLPAVGVSQNIMLNAIFAGVLGGIATGMVYRAGGTSAGTGIISRVLQMKTGIPMSQSIPNYGWADYFCSGAGVWLGSSTIFACHAIYLGFGYRLCARGTKCGPDGVYRHRQADPSLGGFVGAIANRRDRLDRRRDVHGKAPQSVVLYCKPSVREPSPHGCYRD